MLVRPARHREFQRADQCRRGRVADGSQIELETGTWPTGCAEPTIGGRSSRTNDNQLAASSHDSLGPISRVVLTVVLLTLWIRVFFARSFSP